MTNVVLTDPGGRPGFARAEVAVVAPCCLGRGVIEMDGCCNSFAVAPAAATAAGF